MGILTDGLAGAVHQAVLGYEFEGGHGPSAHYSAFCRYSKLFQYMRALHSIPRFICWFIHLILFARGLKCRKQYNSEN